MKHESLKRFDKHLSRIVWGYMAVYILIWIHPMPASVKAISTLLGLALISFSIGVTVASRIIKKAEGKE